MLGASRYSGTDSRATCATPTGQTRTRKSPVSSSATSTAIQGEDIKFLQQQSTVDIFVRNYKAQCRCVNVILFACLYSRPYKILAVNPIAFMTNVECRGNELSLYQCRNEGWMIPQPGLNFTNFCGTGRAAGVACFHNGINPASNRHH